MENLNNLDIQNLHHIVIFQNYFIQIIQKFLEKVRGSC